MSDAAKGLWGYDFFPSGEPYSWPGTNRGDSPWDNLDFHVDLGCGRLKKGRIGVDRYPAEGVDVVCNFETLSGYWPASASTRHSFKGALPFGENAIESVISHHALEHIGDGFIALMDDVYRVLKPGGIFRIIVPLFPSWSAVSDPDHRRYFMAEDNGPCTFDSFCGTPGDTPENCWLSSFSVPYTTARFEKVHQDMSPPAAPGDQWTSRDARELRVALKAVKG